jgi:hypothetical protein
MARSVALEKEEEEKEEEEEEAGNSKNVLIPLCKTPHNKRSFPL